MNKTELLIIDPQFDFCDPSGSLYVDGANKDMERLSSMIKKTKSQISQIRVTLDSHHIVDVAHPLFWKNSNGKNPDPFTIISFDDVKNGVWKPFLPSLNKRMISYVETLAKNGQYQLCIWPPHCLIGSQGHCVYPKLYEALVEWETNKPWNIDYVTKGSNIFTEHYGAVEAEVPDPEDYSTQINTPLITALMNADNILVAGEAGSHCLKTTVEQIAFRFKDDSYIKKITLLTDATSSVISPYVDFPAIQEKFIKDMVSRGMQLTTTVDFAS